MPQFARPISDITVGNWTGSGGVSTQYQDVDEVTVAYTDYVFSANAPAGDYIEFGLTSLTTPSASVDTVVINFQCGKGLASGSSATLDGSGDTVGVQVKLFEGTTEIAAASVYNPSGVWLQSSLTLTLAQKDSIVDWTNLRLRFIATSGGGAARCVMIAWVELQAPPTDVSSSLLGQVLGLVLGALVINSSLDLNLTGQPLALTQGALEVNFTPEVNLTGLSLGLNQGILISDTGPSSVTPSGVLLVLNQSSTIQTSSNFWLNGLPLTLAIGTPTVNVANQDVFPTTLELLFAFGTPTITADLNINESLTGLGLTLTQGTPTVIDGVAPESQVFNLGLGELVINVLDTPILSGQVLTLNQSSTVNTSINLYLDGLLLSLGLGQPVDTAPPSVELTGLVLSLSQGVISTEEITSNILGQFLTLAQATVVEYDLSDTIDGQALTLNQGVLIGADGPVLQGQNLIFTQGILNVGGNIDELITGQTLQLLLGSVSALDSIDSILTGLDLSLALNELVITIDPGELLTGLEVTLNQGTLTLVSDTVDSFGAIGQSLTLTQGNLNVSADLITNLNGLEILFNLGVIDTISDTITINLIGLELSLGLTDLCNVGIVIDEPEIFAGDFGIEVDPSSSYTNELEPVGTYLREKCS